MVSASYICVAFFHTCPITAGALLPTGHGQDETGTTTSTYCGAHNTYGYFLPDITCRRRNILLESCSCGGRHYVRKFGRSNGQPTQSATVVPEPTHGPHISSIDRSNDNQRLPMKALYMTGGSETHQTCSSTIPIVEYPNWEEKMGKEQGVSGTNSFGLKNQLYYAQMVSHFSRQFILSPPTYVS